MATIPGIVYLIIGGAVAFISNKLAPAESKFSFFFWIGILFIVIGTFKTIIWFITQKEKTKRPAKRPTLQPVNRQTQKKDTESHPKYCAGCGLLYSQHSNYCSRCGAQLYIRP